MQATNQASEHAQKEDTIIKQLYIPSIACTHVGVWCLEM